MMKDIANYALMRNANGIPQLSELSLVRRDDIVLVWCGSVEKSARTIRPDEVAVPDYSWKIVYIYIKDKRDTLAYHFPNSATVSGTLTEFRVGIDSVRHLSGLRFRIGK